MFEALPAAGACGNGKHDDGEECDDGNTLDAQNSPDKKSDGCTRLCQIEAGWKCPEVGKCDPPQCGDGILAASEACDDKNTDDGDGCSKDCKTVDDKFECRVPGKRCVPKCGDGHKVGSEGCDDGNTMDGDGCSALCLVEPGSSCDTSKEPSVCTKSVCGNGKMEAGESCDFGDDPKSTKRNGVFLGDGMGCSKTCTTEPTCRDKNGKNQACTAVCGDGNLDMSGGEQCDDGNHADGDGCTKDCKTESGFMCDTIKKPDTSPCANGTGTCLQLPVVYRDFKSQHETGGHPDFFYHSTMQQCIPNTSGPARCGDATARCWGIVQDSLVNGKPQLNGSPTCPCQFTDWSVKNDGNHVPGYTGTNSPITMSTSNNSGAPVITATAVPIVKSKATFDQWYNDSAGSSPANAHTVGTLELSMLAGAQNRFRFSSDPDAVKGGFFPLDATPMNTKAGTTAGGEPLLCNLWPYWYSTTMFGAGAGCKGDQYLFPPSVPAGTMCDANGNPNCVNGAWVTGLQGYFHDAWFTDEVHYYFTFTDAFDLQFYGDDDLFIFVNGTLVIDLGGVHQRLPGKVSIGDDGNATITEGGFTDANGDILPCPSQDPLDPMMKGNCKVVAKTGVDCRQRTVSLGLKKGSTYEIAIFGADRGATESNYQLTLNGFATNQTVCTPRCGDGVTTGAEECDCSDGSGKIPDSCNGQKNDDKVYGGCTTQCKYGAYCGDGHTDSDAGEVCDEGKDNGATYSDDPSGATGCSVTCQRPHFCGDGHPDAAFGEQCDLGDKNGQVIDNGGGKQCVVCDSKCQIRPEC